MTHPVMSATWREAYARYHETKPKLTQYGSKVVDAARLAKGQAVALKLLLRVRAVRKPENEAR